MNENKILEIADIAEAGGKLHWAVAMRDCELDRQRWKWLWERDADLRAWAGEWWVQMENGAVIYKKMPTREMAIDIAMAQWEDERHNAELRGRPLADGPA